MRSNIDMNALSAALQRPGNDPRVWIMMGVVIAVGHDPAEGHFADIRPTMPPSQETVCCYIAQPYTGNGFGASFPVEVGDTVLAASANGDHNTGPVIFARWWSASDRPPAVVGENGEPTQDVVIKVKAGQNIKIIVEDGGKVFLGDHEGTFPLARADKVDARLDRLETFASAHVHVGAAPGSPVSTPQMVPPIVTVPPALPLVLPVQNAPGLTTGAETVEGL
jgi:hypothetical protein